jgi:hypothetical protein
MHQPPLPSWYLYTVDTQSVRLLTDDGAPSPELNGEPVLALASLCAALQASSHMLGELELRHLEQFVAMQRWLR